MWSPVAFCVFVVGLVLASNPGWEQQSEYLYEIRGRTLATLQDVTNKYSGIFLRANLLVHPLNDGRIRMRVLEPKYGEIHTELPNGWESEIPDSFVAYKDLPLTKKTFEVHMKDGVIRNIAVEKDLPSWEVNILKSIASQLQLDTRGRNVLNGHKNLLPEEGRNDAVFTTLEDTVTGTTETKYDIHPIPESLLQNRPDLLPFPELKQDGEVIEIVKSKNFSNSKEIPSYYFGFSQISDWIHHEPATNQLGEIMTRSSLGRAIVTGNLNKYVLQFSETINKILARPTRSAEQKGLVVSYMRVKLIRFGKITEQLSEIPSRVELGSLVYSYDEEINQNNNEARNYQNWQKDSESSVDSEENWTMDKPALNKVPRSPFLPLTIGYKGLSVKQSSQVDLVQRVKQLLKEIVSDIAHENEIPKRQTLSKFVLLTSLVRIMDLNELKQISDEVYDQNIKSETHTTWKAFRDAVAESGTGPSFLMIKEWIESEKIKNFEAAQVISTMSEAVRTPTVEYMRSFYNLVIDSLKNQRAYVNETSLLSYCVLVNKVYVNKYASHNQYPVHNYGRFDTKEGKRFVEKELIPYLAEQLRSAVSEANARKIHIYTRALGNVGHKDILNVFEPYLEGKKQTSQFQRFFMVQELKNLLILEPSLVRNVLYRMYQNTGETSEIRVLCVYMLMRTHPSVEVLQRMAESTQYETNAQVASAIKSAINSMAKLKSSSLQKMKNAAEAARPMLTKKDFGVQDPQMYLENYIDRDMDSYVKGIIGTYTSEGSGIPNSLFATIEKRIHGYVNSLFYFEGFTSNLDNVYNLLRSQTKSFLYQQEKQQQNKQNHKFSSENIARLLNLKSEDLEQLEGFMNLNWGEIHQHMSFENMTIERLPQLIEKLEETLKEQQQFQWVKMINNREMAIAFPTEMGLPFLYTVDTPVLAKVQGEIKATATPKLYSNGKLQSPDEIKLDSKISFTVTYRKQGEMGIITPFNHKQYTVGFGKTKQIHLPIQSKLSADLKNKMVQVTFKPIDDSESIRIFHQSSWPFISQRDILKLKPSTLRDQNSEVILKGISHFKKQEFGEQQTGMVFKIHFETDRKQGWGLKNLKDLILNDNIHYSQLNVDFEPQRSANTELKMMLNYRERKVNEDMSSKKLGKGLNKLSNLPLDCRERAEVLLERAANEIKYPHVRVATVKIEFNGKQQTSYRCNAVYADSNVDETSRVWLYMNKQTQIPGRRPQEAGAVIESTMKRTNGLDAEFAMDLDATSKVQMVLGMDEKLPTEDKVEVDVGFRKSEVRKQYLQKTDTYDKCRRQMHEGNKQLGACANITQEANRFDRVNVEIRYPNQIKSQLRQHATADLHKYISSNDKNEIYVTLRFDETFETANVTIKGGDTHTHIHRCEFSELAQDLLVVHPTFNVMTRFMARVKGLKTFRHFCTIDQTKTKTFDDKTYPVELNDLWTVVLQYVPRRQRGFASVSEQLKHQIENFVVLARRSKQDPRKKEVKVVMSMPETEGKSVEIVMEPSGKSLPKVLVDGQQISYSEIKQHRQFENSLEIFALPNNEAMVKIADHFYVIFDGERIKVSTENLRLRNAIRGLCGTFDGEKTTDLLAAHNCVAREAREFVASYTVVPEGERNEEILNLRSNLKDNHCVYKNVPMYVNVISEEDSKPKISVPRKCFIFQTKYVEENDQICFTVKPQTVCKQGCESRDVLRKPVQVHCVKNMKNALTYKSLIDEGASPDFRNHAVTKTLHMDVPKTCRPY